MTKTITLTGEEIAVKLDKAYPYIWVQNLGDSDVYMSVKPGIVPEADGVITVPAGGGASTGEVEQTNTVYFLGSGKVEVSPQFNAFCPFFKAAGKGGDSTYTLPVAAADTLGGIKPDNKTVSVNSEGVLSTKLTLYKSGKIMRSVNDTPVEIDLPVDSWYLIALDCDGIPPFALYIARRTDQIALVRLAVHSAAENNIYAYASVRNVNGVNSILIHSTDSGNVDYKIYKLPF